MPPPKMNVKPASTHAYKALKLQDPGTTDVSQHPAQPHGPDSSNGSGSDSDTSSLCDHEVFHLRGTSTDGNVSLKASLTKGLQEPTLKPSQDLRMHIQGDGDDDDDDNGNDSDDNERTPFVKKDADWQRYRTRCLAVMVFLLTVNAVLLIWKPWQGKDSLAPVYNSAVKDLPEEQPIWPIPRSFTYGNQTVVLSPGFQIKLHFNTGEPLSPGTYPILEKAVARCMDRLQFKRNTTIPGRMPTEFGIINTPAAAAAADHGPVLSELTVIVGNPQAALEFGMKEAYAIDVHVQDDSPAAVVLHHLVKGSVQERAPIGQTDKVNATLTASTQWGVLHGLETFSQLVQAVRAVTSNELTTAPDQKTDNQLEIPNTPWLIQDEPRYSHRGILLDTSRNYYFVKDILRTLDAMSTVKLNVFHWHVLDQQTYPLVSKTYPELTAKRAERPDYLYTPDDVALIVQYGEERGIRVVPEFDAPGHTASWGRAFPNITVCLDKQPHYKYAAEPPPGQLDPLEPFTYTVLNNLIQEWAVQFPDRQVHAGGDEINMACWRSDDRLRDYIKHPKSRAGYEKRLMPVETSSGMDDTIRQTNARSIFVQSGEDRLLQVYLDRAFGMYTKNGKRPIVWEEIALEHDVRLPDSAIVQVWKSAGNAKRVIKQGRPVILSSADFWYLDCGFGQWLLGSQRESWCKYRSWQKVYSYRLTDKLNTEEQKLVYGGEVCLWSEQSDPSNLDSNLWPRSAAAAEILWSGSQDEKGEYRPLLHAAKRLVAVRERLHQMGVAASPVFPAWCGKHLEACLA